MPEEILGDIECALPPQRKRPVRSRPKLEQVQESVDKIIREDQRASRKQWHTAHRIFDRLRAEVSSVEVSERTVGQYACERRKQLDLVACEVFTPQQYEWGVGAQVGYLNGTFVNGRPLIKPVTLKTGDVVSLSDWRFRVELYAGSCPECRRRTDW